jgi:hypothetical protein
VLLTARLTDSIAPARLGRPFRWLLASSLVTNVGDGIALAAGPLLVASQDRTGRWRSWSRNNLH